MSGDLDKAIADAREARESHVTWLKWWRHMENCNEPGCVEVANYHKGQYAATETRDGEWGVEYEERWVAAYDNILACLGAT